MNCVQWIAIHFAHLTLTDEVLVRAIDICMFVLSSCSVKMCWLLFGLGRLAVNHLGMEGECWSASFLYG